MLEADPAELDVCTLDRLARDAPARRELIWLLAKIKGDHQHAREIERFDSGIRRRLAPLMAKAWHALHGGGASPKTPTKLYELAFDQRFAHHAARYAGGVCRCIQCQPSSTGAG
jgi:hypothetical protein